MHNLHDNIVTSIDLIRVILNTDNNTPPPTVWKCIVDMAGDINDRYKQGNTQGIKQEFISLRDGVEKPPYLYIKCTDQCTPDDILNILMFSLTNISCIGIHRGYNAWANRIKGIPFIYGGGRVMRRSLSCISNTDPLRYIQNRGTI